MPTISIESTRVPVMARRVDPTEALTQVRRAGLMPMAEYPGVDRPWRCKCLTCGAEVSPRLASIRRGQGGCSFCARTKSALARRTPAEEATRLAKDFGFVPLEPYRRSTDPWRCRCLTCGKESSPTFGNLKRGHKCRFCAGRAPLDSVVVSSILEKHGLTALEPYVSSLKPMLCVHNVCGTVVGVRLAGLRHGQRGPCNVCGRIQGTKKKRYSQEEVIALLDEMSFVPSKDFVYERRDQQIPCTCATCGNRINPTFANILAGHGCQFCAPYGFDVNRDGYLYILISVDGLWGKFGITHNWSQRLRQHQTGGFFCEKVFLSDVRAGKEVVEVERKLLVYFIDYPKCPRDVPGYTESFPASLIPQALTVVENHLG
jgi:hypothetical protein